MLRRYSINAAVVGYVYLPIIEPLQVVQLCSTLDCGNKKGKMIVKAQAYEKFHSRRALKYSVILSQLGVQDA